MTALKPQSTCVISAVTPAARSDSRNEDLRETLDAGGRQRLDRAGGNAIDADASRTEARCEVAHAGLEARLGESHCVVARHSALGAEVGQCQQGPVAALHQRQRRLGERRKAVGRDVVRNAKSLARQPIDEVAGDRFARREADRVHQSVERRPALLQGIEGGSDLGIVRHVHVEHEIGAELRRDLGDPLLEAVAHVGESEFGAFTLAGVRDAVGDRAVGKHTGDQQSLAGQEAHVVSSLAVLWSRAGSIGGRGRPSQATGTHGRSASVGDDLARAGGGRLVRRLGRGLA